MSKTKAQRAKSKRKKEQYKERKKGHTPLVRMTEYSDSASAIAAFLSGDHPRESG